MIRTHRSSFGCLFTLVSASYAVWLAPGEAADSKKAIICAFQPRELSSAHSDGAVAGVPTGACCNPDNSCVVVAQDVCELEALGAYQGDVTSCEDANCDMRCDPPPKNAGCESCWVGSINENNCPPEWEADGVCDCGCQFDDPDCGPTGACCLPRNASDSCRQLTEPTCVESFGGLFNGIGVDCSVADCKRCNDVCEWCWVGTILEGDCPPDFNGDGECDCGCQFVDSDCVAPATECSAEDTCDNLGNCEPNDLPAGTPCGEGATECGVQDRCDGNGVCLSEFEPEGLPCGDPSDTACDNPDTCDGSGSCAANTEPDGLACDDGIFCNGTEACSVGACTEFVSAACPREKLCNEETDTCDDCPDPCEPGRICLDDEVPRCVDCEVAEDCPLPACAVNWVASCVENTCDYTHVGSTVCLIDVNGALECAADGEVNPTESCEACLVKKNPRSWTTLPDGTGCSDRDACTSNEVCVEGICMGRPIPNCPCFPSCEGRQCGSDGCGGSCGECTDPDVCNPANGICVCAPDCTDRECGADGCGGSCGDCADDHACIQETGLCEPCNCDDGDPCNGREECVAGFCAAGEPLDCDDNDACTIDACDPLSGCTHTLTGCNDNDTCTVDSCDPVSGCVNTLQECQDDKQCQDGVCSWALAIQGLVLSGAEPARQLPLSEARYAEVEGVEIPVPVAPCNATETCIFVRWEGLDVPAGSESADPLVLTVDANKNVTAVFQVVECVDDADCEGTCIDGCCCSQRVLCGNCCDPGFPACAFILMGLLCLRLVGPGTRGRTGAQRSSAPACPQRTDRRERRPLEPGGGSDDLKV